MKAFKGFLCILLCAVCFSLSCCNTDGNNLAAQYSRSQAIPSYNFYSDDISTPEVYSEFAEAYMDFAAAMLKNSNTEGSCVLSPFSLYTALAMTANGTQGKTLSQLESLLGQDLDISEINNAIYYLGERITSIYGETGKISTANSLWLEDEFSVKAQFLQTTVNYFNADVYRTKLSETGAEEINGWISKNTDGKIENLVSHLSSDTQMVLVNAMLFNDEWISPYAESQILTDTFYGSTKNSTASFMKSNEMLIKSTDAKGFVKSYKNTPCRLVAILPNEGVSLEDYISSLSGAKLQSFLNSVGGASRCVAAIPQFELSTKLSLKETVKTMGTDIIFENGANFDGLTMSGSLAVSDILQESFFKLSPTGTEAGSATVESVYDISSQQTSDAEELTFNRPFIFMLVENESNLPLFIGTVKNIG